MNVADQMSELIMLMSKGITSKFDQAYRDSKLIVSNMFGVSEQFLPFDWSGSETLGTSVQVNVCADELKTMLNSSAPFPRCVCDRTHSYSCLSHILLICSAVMLWMSRWLAYVYMPSIQPRSKDMEIRYSIFYFVCC
jgi:hypothetical protein